MFTLLLTKSKTNWKIKYDLFIEKKLIAKAGSKCQYIGEGRFEINGYSFPSNFENDLVEK